MSIEGFASRLTRSDMTDTAYDKICIFMRDKTGIALDRGSRRIVFSRLLRRVEATGFDSFDEYIDRVISGEAEGEVDQAISALTTNTTRFFRESDQFKVFVQEVVPEIQSAARNGGRVRLWTAACSSGEEAYSLAAVLLDSFPEVSKYDVRILATDIDRDVLARAELAEYDLAEDDFPEYGGIDMLEIVHGFKNKFRVKEEIRNLVTVRYLNFMEPWPVSGPFHAIFCRNAAIYMDLPIQNRLWAGLTSVLAKKGCLFIGHSERLSSPLSARFIPIGRNAFRLESPMVVPRDHDSVVRSL